MWQNTYKSGIFLDKSVLFLITRAMYDSYDNQYPKYVRCTHTGQLVDVYPAVFIIYADRTSRGLLFLEKRQK